MPNINDNIADASSAPRDAQDEGHVSHEQSASAQFEVGSYVTFGRYPQNNGDTPEPIEWLVLDNDGKTAMLLSKFGLDCRPFHGDIAGLPERGWGWSYWDYWEKCDLRLWLNSDFLQNAFTSEERICVCQSRRIGEWNYSCACDITDPLFDSGDKIFCLSAYEAYCFLRYDSARKCQPTAYAVSRGASKNDFNGCCNYWLSTSVEDGFRNLHRVGSFGTILDELSIVHANNVAVRPALRIKL